MPVVMSETEARIEIESLSCSGDWPALTAVHINRCVKVSKRPDSQGLDPDQTLWEPTWDTAAGISLAWQLKAGLAAGKYDFETNQQKVKRSQVAMQCNAQAALWQQQMEPVSAKFKTYESLDVEPDEYFQRGYNIDGVRRI